MSWRSEHRERVAELEAEAAKLMMDALAAVVDRVADRLGVVTAAAEGEARASVDDLAAITAEWKATVDQVVLPYFGGIFQAGAHAGEEQLVGLGVVVPAGDPELVDTAARQYLAQVQDRFYGLGDVAWENARAELLAGFQAGEGIGDLRARVRRATGLSRYRAEAIARTEVIGASNMGADARVAMLGADAPPFKQWLSTMDARTRPTHVRADGQVVRRGDPFVVGGHSLQVPGAPTGPPEEVVNCRCTVLYLDTPEPIDPEGRQQGGPDRDMGAVDLVAETAAAVLGPPQVDTTTGEPHTGAMLALVPAAPEAFAIEGGEPAEQLHVTLAFLGEVADMPPELPGLLQQLTDGAARGLQAPGDANVFGAAVWNTTGDTPSLNLSVGGAGLQALHDTVWANVVAAATEATGWVPPANHAPWVAHMCLLYGDHEYGLEPFFAAVTAATQLEGPIVFDRLRLALGSQAYDYPLGSAVVPEPVARSMSSDPPIAAGNSVQSVTPQEGTVPWTIRKGGADCPFEVVKEGTDERAGCHDTEQEAQQQVEALYAQEGEGDAAAEPEATADVRPPAEPGEHLRARMHTQGSTTGDRQTGRMFTNTTYRDTPFAFHWSKASSAHGGQPHVVHVGNVVRVVPGAGPGEPDWGFVTLDLEADDGREYGRRAVAGFERWVSIGLDETKPTVTMDWADGPAEGDDPLDLAKLFDDPELVTVDGGRVGELTGVSVPAQADAEIEPTDELIKLLMGSPEPEQEEAVAEPATAAVHVTAEPEPEPTVADAVQALTAAAYTITIPELPPSWWYQEPTDVDLSEGALNVTDDGRIYGALAPLGVNHRAFARAGRRQEAPIDRVDYARFMGAWALTTEGKVPAGPVTMDCGHAARFRANHDVAPAHYENACTVVAKIAVGVNRGRRVVWAAGALEPGVTIDQVSRMLACRLSGDWQPHSDRPGWTELIAALLVPSPGFPMAHGASATWEGEALVASSVPVRAVGHRGRPRLRVDLSSRTVERVNLDDPAVQARDIVAAVRSGKPVPPPRQGCC